jgi:hypothetical protein
MKEEIIPMRAGKMIMGLNILFMTLFVANVERRQSRST